MILHIWVIFDKNLDVSRKFWIFVEKIGFLSKILDFCRKYVCRKFLVFGESKDVCQKIWIFGENVDVCRKNCFFDKIILYYLDEIEGFGT